MNDYIASIIESTDTALKQLPPEFRYPILLSLINALASMIPNAQKEYLDALRELEKTVFSHIGYNPTKSNMN